MTGITTCWSAHGRLKRSEKGSDSCSKDFAKRNTVLLIAYISQLNAQIVKMCAIVSWSVQIVKKNSVFPVVFQTSIGLFAPISTSFKQKNFPLHASPVIKTFHIKSATMTLSVQSPSAVIATSHYLLIPMKIRFYGVLGGAVNIVCDVYKLKSFAYS